MRREFWFSQALEDAEGGTWPPSPDYDPFDFWSFHSDGGLIEKRGDSYYAEGYLRPDHELEKLPEDAVRLVPEPADDPESAEAKVTARDAARGVGPREAT